MPLTLVAMYEVIEIAAAKSDRKSYNGFVGGVRGKICFVINMKRIGVSEILIYKV